MHECVHYGHIFFYFLSLIFLAVDFLKHSSIILVIPIYKALIFIFLMIKLAPLLEHMKVWVSLSLTYNKAINKLVETCMISFG